MESCEISIIIPVYNEEDNLPLLIEGLAGAMAKLTLPYEIIAVDDGSGDMSLQVLKQLSAKFTCLRIIKFTHNCGQSAAFTAGFRLASGSIIVTMDADLQYDPEDISRLLAKLDKYDMVCGWRKNRHDPWLKLFSTKVANSV
ncbi:MAG: glycosyltransferase family 2 protein, partial [Candidatus Omnitrophica bacterium]|nr:glycosyltransferase family 2 protein [Candidatus Omnitrophota bacterium]